MKIMKRVNMLWALAIGSVLVLNGPNVFAQRGKDVMAPTPDYQAMPSEEMRRDVQSRMQKFDEIYQRLKQRFEQVRNQELKADLDKMLTQMDAVRQELAKTEPDRARVRALMEELRAMREQMKAKYGDRKEGRAGKGAGKPAQGKPEAY